jgi:hypothetical protein
MRKLFLLVSFTLTFLFNSFGQESFDIKYLTSEISYLNQTIIRQAKKQKISICESQILHIYWLNYEGPMIKSVFISQQFLGHLYPTYYQKTKFYKTTKLLNTEGLICNKDGTLFASSDCSYIFKFTNTNSTVSKKMNLIAELLFKKEIDYCFYICGTPIGNYFCVKDDAIFVIGKSNSDKEMLCPLNDYVEQNWEEFTKHNFLINTNKHELNIK